MCADIDPSRDAATVFDSLDLIRHFGFPISRTHRRVAGSSFLHSGKLTVSRDIARTELARRLVQLSKEGVRDEGKLIQAGLSHLRELTLKGGKQNP